MTDDEFQQVADAINALVARTVADALPDLLRKHGGKEDVGPLIVAVMAGMISCAGRLCASFEPNGLKGDLMASVVRDQFNAGRRDQQARNHTDGTA